MKLRGFFVSETGSLRIFGFSNDYIGIHESEIISDDLIICSPISKENKTYKYVRNLVTAKLEFPHMTEKQLKKYIDEQI